MGTKELVDIEADIVHETDRALLLDDGKRRVWIPKSQIENNGDGTFTLSIRLAQEKELI